MNRELHILLLEDRPADAELVIRELRREGLRFEPKCVLAEADFLEQLQAFQPDLILADYSLPSYDGRAALAAARTHCPEIPFIFVSGTLGEETAIEALHHGATDYVLKERLSRLGPAVQRALRAAQDRRQRQQAETALQEASQFNQQVIACAQEGIVVYGPDLRYKLWNPDMERLTGLPAGEILGKRPEDIFPFLRQGGVLSALEKALAGDTIRSEFFFHVERTGAQGWVADTSGPLRDSTGAIIGVIGIVRNITEHKCLQEQFFQAAKMEAIGQLAGGVAHDFNNILAAVLLNLGLLQQNPQLAPDIQASLKEVEKEALRATSLTRQLLVFSRREVAQRKLLELNELLQNLLKMLRRLLGENVEVVFLPAPTPVWVAADPGMMEQVAMNLCINARDAMPRGGRLVLATSRVEVSAATLRPGAKPGQFVCLSVTDTGCGMDESTLKRIFEPFFTTKEPGKGTGLGLATVHGIINQHQGWVEVASAVGQGTTFRVYVPATAPPASERLEIPAAKPRGGTETILVVEDDEQVRRLVKLSLRIFGYEVLEAANGAEALQQWERQGSTVSLVFTDMVMPGGLTGLELVQRLRQLKPGLKAVISSGYSAELLHREGGLPAGLKVLAKPYDPDSLARAVRECLDKREELKRD